jgi:DNA polymerase IV
VIYRDARELLAKEADGTAFRLIGVGLSQFDAPGLADPPDLLDPRPGQLRAIEIAIDKVRARFGDASIGKGRALALDPSPVSSRPAASPAAPVRPSGRMKSNPTRDRR